LLATQLFAQLCVPAGQASLHGIAGVMQAPAQSLVSLGHSAPHCVPSQVATPPVGFGHGSHAVPQLATALSSTQASWHTCCRGSHWHSPSTQWAPLGQAASLQHCVAHAPSDIPPEPAVGVAELALTPPVALASGLAFAPPSPLGALEFGIAAGALVPLLPVPLNPPVPATETLGVVLTPALDGLSLGCSPAVGGTLEASRSDCGSCTMQCALRSTVPVGQAASEHDVEGRLTKREKMNARVQISIFRRSPDESISSRICLIAGTTVLRNRNSLRLRSSAHRRAADQTRGSRSHVLPSNVDAGQTRSLRDGHLGRESPRPQNAMALLSDA
jgi:hypothetical protein